MNKKFSLDTSKKVFPIILMVLGLGIMIAQFVTRLNLVAVVGVGYCCIMSAIIFLSLIIKKKVYAPMIFGYGFVSLGEVLFHIIWGVDAGFGAITSSSRSQKTFLMDRIPSREELTRLVMAIS
jgi:hypothetical protein